MREIEATNFEARGDNLHMVVKATGKPLIIRLKDVKWRRGDFIFIEDWLYNRIEKTIKGA